jgi:metallo-beta-lactamase class B
VSCAAAQQLSAQNAFEADAPINCYSCDEWNQPQEPFQVFGNTYYVGMAGVSAVLVDGGSELLLLDAGLPQSAAPILANIRKLGFDPEKISTIMLSHAHYDHAGGINAIQRYSGAKVLSSEAGAASLNIGDLLPNDPQYDQPRENRMYPAVENVTVVENGSEYVAGDVTIRGIFTPGHTPGGMSWTWQSCEQERCLDIVYADSIGPVSVDGYRFSDGLGGELAASARRIAEMDCDILLVTHPFVINLQEKFAKGRAAFIDPGACKNYGEKTLEIMQKRLASENP